MSDIEATKRNVAQAFSSVVRSSSVSEKLDPQQMMMVVSSMLGPLKEGEPLDLTLLAEFLKTEKRLMNNEIEELLVLFNAREEQLGLVLTMPPSMQNIPDARRDKILEKFAKGILQPGFGASKTASGAAKTSTASKTSAPERDAYEGRKKISKGALQRNQIIAACVFIVVGAAFAAYQYATLPDPPKKVALTNAKLAFNCVTLTFVKSTAFCAVNADEVAEYDQKERTKRSEAALADLRSQGHVAKRWVLVNAQTGARLK